MGEYGSIRTHILKVRIHFEVVSHHAENKIFTKEVQVLCVMLDYNNFTVKTQREQHHYFSEYKNMLIQPKIFHMHSMLTTLLITTAPQPRDLVSSAAGDAEDGLELLEDDELQAGGGREAGPDGDESRVQAPGSVLGHNLHRHVVQGVLGLVA